MPSDHENNQNCLKNQNFDFLGFFDHFERFQDARSVFNFVILKDLGSRSLKSGKIHGPGHAQEMRDYVR